jgi:tetratricopeptide (TPR) repeat protein
VPAETTGYRLTQDRLELPTDFGEDFATALTAVALAGVSPATERQGEYLVTLLRPAITKLDALIAGRVDRFSPDQRGALHHALGLGSAIIGQQAGDNEALQQAVAAYRAALAECTRERVPLQWATTQNNLGNALRALGGRESGTGRLEEAVAAYCAALAEFTRERVPLDWAMTQNNLGNALSTLGERESGTGRLEEAVDAFRAALGVFEEAGTDYYIQLARGNLARAEALIAERRREP